MSAMNHLTFRDATPADITTILRLSHGGDARGAETPPFDDSAPADPRVRAAFDAISGDPRHRLIVAEQDGEIVGTLQISFIPGLSHMGAWRGMLENVHIRADQRGTGLGTLMVQWAIARCREAGCGLVQLTSQKVRKDAHRFYERLGFANTHEGFKLKL